MYLTNGYEPHILYHNSLHAVSSVGVESKPRGTVTRELVPAVVEYPSTSPRFIVVPGRGINHCFSIAECVGLLLGIDDAAFYGTYNKRIMQFADKDGKLHGAYGRRLAVVDQIRKLISRLKLDADSRRAVLAIWNPVLDLEEGHIDYPCNVMAIFKAQDQQLHASVVRRSSDLVWGVPHDHAVFTVLHDTVAASVGMSSGRHTEFSNSLHFYVGLYDDVLDKLLSSNRSTWYSAGPAGRPTLPYDKIERVLRHWHAIPIAVRVMTGATCLERRDRLMYDDGDAWWADALTCLDVYVLWSKHRYEDALFVASRLLPEFQQVVWSTFEARESLSKQTDTFRRTFTALQFGRSAPSSGLVITAGWR